MDRRQRAPLHHRGAMAEVPHIISTGTSTSRHQSELALFVVAKGNIPPALELELRRDAQPSQQSSLSRVLCDGYITQSMFWHCQSGQVIRECVPSRRLHTIGLQGLID